MDTIKFLDKEYKILEKFRSKKLLVERNNKRYVIVPFNDEKSLNGFLNNKKILKKMKVEMAKVLKVDYKGLMVLEQYVIGESATSILAMNRLTDYEWMELFRVYRNNRFAQILLNYEPNNFVKHGKWFYYVGCEVTPINKGIAFERSNEILCWLNTPEQKKYIASKGYPYFERELINSSAETKKKIALLCTAFW